MTTSLSARPAQRLLESAGRLFAVHGIRAVGIDQIIADAGVAKASLYQSFGSKEALVVAYLERQDTLDRAAYRAATTGTDTAADRILRSFDLAIASARQRAYRGCLFLNAVTEFPRADHPVAKAVEAHRAWLRAQWLEALAERGPERATLVDRVQILYDGAVAGAKAARSVAPITLAREMTRDLLTV